MPRLMSVAFTEAAVRDHSKTVTRRRGWQFLKAGDHLTLCRKVMGRKKDEPLVRVAEVEVVSVRRESLELLDRRLDLLRYAELEMAREGFPGLDPREFVRRYFVEAQGMDPDATVTRIEWRYLPRVWRSGDSEPEDKPRVLDDRGSPWEWRAVGDKPISAYANQWHCLSTSGHMPWQMLVGCYGPVTEVLDATAS